MKEKLKLEGKLVTLEEIEPKFFPYVIKWRNDPKLNRYLNQPFVLTEELEQRWYDNVYTTMRGGQGFLIGIDKKSGKPFGTIGWEGFDLENSCCYHGRLLCSDPIFSLQLIDMQFTFSDFMHEKIETIFISVAKINRQSLRFNKSVGFVENRGKIQYPENLMINGMEHVEMYRTKEMYLDIRNKFHSQFPEIF